MLCAASLFPHDSPDVTAAMWSVILSLPHTQGIPIDGRIIWYMNANHELIISLKDMLFPGRLSSVTSAIPNSERVERIISLSSQSRSQPKA
jgi:hypothetical protein